MPGAVGQPEALQGSSCRCAHRRLQNTMKKHTQSYHATPGKIRLRLNWDFSSRFPIPSSSTSCFQEEGTCSPSEKRELLPGPAHVLLPLSTSVWNTFEKSFKKCSPLSNHFQAASAADWWQRPRIHRAEPQTAEL